MVLDVVEGLGLMINELLGCYYPHLWPPRIVLAERIVTTQFNGGGGYEFQMWWLLGHTTGQITGSGYDQYTY